ncbi:MAG: PilZ domain-containing protein [Pyrinomonadaceae bacterium]
MGVNKASDKRSAKRFKRSDNIVVKAKLAEGEFWKEKAKLTSVSRLGAGFEITRQCKTGQLVSLLLALPVNLRAFDHDKELYRVWGLVQHCNTINTEDFTGYHVGIAFIGNDAPPSFYEKHDQSYRIVGLNSDGLWIISEAEREFVNRKHPRFWVSLKATLTMSDAEDENVMIVLQAQTENISKSGAAVFCETEANVGDHLVFSLPEFEFEAGAIVRNRQGVGNTTPKIHMEFLDNEFPVEKLEMEVEK